MLECSALNGKVVGSSPITGCVLSCTYSKNHVLKHVQRSILYGLSLRSSTMLERPAFNREVVGAGPTDGNY